jgi:methionyl-tRNA formyltransferase
VEKFNSLQCESLLDSLNPDLLAIASAPILNDCIFSKSKYGCLNAHPGWLPKYRGLGANSCAIKNGDAPGITIHYVDSGIDTGEIIVREKIKILHRDSIAKINDRAVARGAELMADVIHWILNNQLELPIIEESVGEYCQTMSYRDVKDLNQMLKRMINHEI